MPEIESYYDMENCESVSHTPNFPKLISIKSGLQTLFTAGIFAVGTMMAPAIAGQDTGVSLVVASPAVVNTSSVINLSMNSAATSALLVEVQSQRNSRQRGSRSNRQNSNRRGNRSGRRADRSRGQRGDRRGQRSNRSRGNRSRGDRSRGDRRRGDGQRSDRQRGDGQRGDRQRGDRQRGDRQRGDRHRGGRRRDDGFRGENNRRRDRSDRRGRRDRGQGRNRRNDRNRFNRQNRRRNQGFVSRGHRGHIGHSRHSNYNRTVYRGRKFAHGYSSKRSHGYFCQEHSLFHYFLGFDPVGFSKTSFYGRRGYRFASSCYPVEKVDYYRGRKALIKAVACYDSYDNLYIKKGSTYVSEYY